MSDNAFACRNSREFQAALAILGAKHRLGRPYRPQTNGKVEKVQPHPARRVGLRQALRRQRRARGLAPGLAPRVQLPSRPHLAGRAPIHLTCQQRVWELHLGPDARQRRTPGRPPSCASRPGSARRGVDAARSQPGPLHGVLSSAHGAEHRVGHGPQVGPVRLAPAREPLLLIRGHVPSSPLIGLTNETLRRNRGRAMTTVRACRPPRGRKLATDQRVTHLRHEACQRVLVEVPGRQQDQPVDAQLQEADGGALVDRAGRLPARDRREADLELA